MNYVFSSLLSGLMLALILVYLLIVVNFQSWRNPFIIITPVPLALSGIIWMLFVSGLHIQRSGSDGFNNGGRRFLC